MAEQRERRKSAPSSRRGSAICRSISGQIGATCFVDRRPSRAISDLDLLPLHQMEPIGCMDQLHMREVRFRERVGTRNMCAEERITARYKPGCLSKGLLMRVVIQDEVVLY